MLNENRFLGTFRGHNTRTTVCMELKGPHRPDAIRQSDANFKFSKTNKTVNG